MAEAHLRTGWDVVMPQLETSVDETERFQLTAERAGAEYVEIALSVEPAEQVRRFAVKATYPELTPTLIHAGSALDNIWLDRLDPAQPVLVTAQGLLLYL